MVLTDLHAVLHRVNQLKPVSLTAYYPDKASVNWNAFSLTRSSFVDFLTASPIKRIVYFGRGRDGKLIRLAEDTFEAQP